MCTSHINIISFSHGVEGSISDRMNFNEVLIHVSNPKDKLEFKNKHSSLFKINLWI
jgi:hypothetical protein